MESWFPTFRRWFTTPWSVHTVRWPWYTTRAQSRALLRLIAVAAEESIPLGPLVTSLAAEEFGIQRYRLLRLARHLEADMPLCQALEAVPNVVADADLLSIRFDAQLGTRTAAMRESLRETLSTRIAGWPRARNTMKYFGVVLVIACSVIAFTQIEIVPVLNELMRTLEVERPAVVAALDPIMRILIDLLAPVLLLAAAMLGFALTTRTGAMARRAFSNRFLSPTSEWNAADLLRKLAVASRAGRPLAGALSTLARHHFDPLIRHGLLFARNEVEQGADVWRSLAAAGLLVPREVRLLETAERVGNRPWVLAQLAELRETRVVRRWDRFSTWLLPVVVGILGAVVIIQAISVMFPLFTLIQSLS